MTIVLKADGSGLTGTVRVAEAELRKLGAGMDQTGTRARGAAVDMDRLDASKRRASNSARELTSSVSGLRGMLSGLGIAFVTREIIEAGLATARWESAFTAITGSGAAAATEMAFLRGEAERLGIYLPTLVDGYQQLAAATRETSLEGQATRDIFIGISEAGRVLKLRTDQVQGALYAVQQMVSKGAVSMEELRRQLGDRIPGAFQIAARAMNMTTAELTKMVETGSLMADEFLPKFNIELRRMYSTGVELAALSPQAVFDRMKTALFELYAVIADSGVMDALVDGAKTMTAAFREFAESGVGKAVGQTIGQLMRLFDDLLFFIAAYYGTKGLLGLGALFQSEMGKILAASIGLEMMGQRASTASIMLTRMGVAARSLFAILGGWVTVAAGAAFALYKLGDALLYGGTTSQQLTATMDEMTRSMQRARREQELVAAGAPEALGAQALAIADSVKHMADLRIETEALGDAWWRWTTAGAAYVAIIEQMNGSGIAEQEASIARLSDELLRTAVNSENSAAAIQEATRALAAAGAPLDNVIDRVVELDTELGRAVRNLDLFFGAAEAGSKKLDETMGKVLEGLTKQANGLEAQHIAMTQGLRASLLWEAAQEAGVKSAADLSEEVRNQVDVIVRLTGALDAGKQAEKASADAKREHKKAIDDLLRSLKRQDDEQRKALIVQEEAKADAHELLDSLREQLGLIGLTSAELRRHTELQALDNLVKKSGGEISAEAAAKMRSELNAILNLIDAKEIAVEAAEDLREANIRAAQESARAWWEFSGQLAEAILEGGGSVKRFWKRMLDDMKKQLIQSGIFALIRQLFGGATGGASAGGGGFWAGLAAMFMGGGSGSAGAATGGSGTGAAVQMGSSMFSSFASSAMNGSGGFNISSLGGTMFSGFAQAMASTPGGLAASFGAGEFSAGFVGPPQHLAGSSGGSASMGGILGGIAGAYYGATQAGSGGLSSAAAAVSYGALGYAVGTGIAAGVAAGSVAAGTAAAAGSFAALGGAAWIPIVGWILAIAALIDIAAGGKLFGTRYRPVGVSSSIGVDADGAFAAAEVRETRQAALFGGLRRRTRSIDPGEEALDAAQALYEGIMGVMQDTARQLGGEVPAMFSAAIRTEQRLGTRGAVKETNMFVDMLGRSWEAVDGEDAARRIGAEAIIYTIDQILGNLVEQVADGIRNPVLPGTPGDGTQPDSGFRPPGIGDGDSVIEKILQMQGEASAIAERWRDDSEVLLDGAQFLLAAAVDIVRGTGLLGEGSGALTRVADLMDELAYASESLSEAYARVRGSTGLLEAATAMMGITLDLEREAFVRFAVDIAEAAGGLERAGALWEDYFKRYYTAEERALFTLNNVMAAAERDFADAGLDLADFRGDGGGQRFRALFEEMLPTLSAQMVVEWLEAANALGVLIDAEAALAAARGNTAELTFRNADAIRQLLAGNEIELLRASMSEYQNAAADVILQYNAQRIELQALGATTSELTALELQRARALAQVIAIVEESTRALIDELGYTPLGQIEAQIAAMEAEAREAGNALGGVAGGLRDIRDAAQEFRDSIMIDSRLSGTSVRDQYTEALRQLRETGDSGTARRALDLARELNASGADYRAARDMITGLVRDQPGADGIGGAGSNPALDALYAERDRLREEANAMARFGQANTLLQNLTDIAGATGEDLADVAARLGLMDLQLLADDLRLPGIEELLALSATLAQFDPLTMISAGEQAIVDALLFTAQMVNMNAGLVPPPILDNGMGTGAFGAAVVPTPPLFLAPGPDPDDKARREATDKAAAERSEAMIGLLAQLVDAVTREGSTAIGQRDAMVQSLGKLANASADPLAKPLAKVPA